MATRPACAHEALLEHGDPLHGDLDADICGGRLADLLLFEGDPFSDISILERPDESLAVIMKQGAIVKER